jgi:hypothetical protein
MESKKRNGDKVPVVWAPQNNTYIEYCATESLGGKIQIMLWTGALTPWALFPHFVLLLDF